MENERNIGIDLMGILLLLNFLLILSTNLSVYL